MIENSYGIVKRLDYIETAITDHKPKRVFDFGCGTGELLTVPLAKKFPDIDFIAVDDDPSSIEFARKKNTEVSNLTFAYPNEIETSTRFDLIIASEVIEHVERPDHLLLFLKDKLETDGRMIITLPNGYGPFEATSFLEAMLFLIGIDAARIYRFFTRESGDTGELSNGKYSLAISPHINFFSFNEICALIEGNGFEIKDHKARSFLCGVGFDQVIRGRLLTSWNNRVAESLPSVIASGWMFTVGSKDPGSGKAEEENAIYKRNKYARLRKRINEKRWGLTA